MRSAWKLPDFNLNILFWNPPLNPERRKISSKIIRKRSLIFQPMAARPLEVYNGKKWISLNFEEFYQGYNIGQFMRTKAFLRHNANKIKKEKAKKAKEIRKKLPKTQTKEQLIHIEAMRRKRKKRK